MTTPTPGDKPAPSRPQARLPAPSLFVGPASRNTSSADLRGQTPITPGASSLLKQRSFLSNRLDGTRSEYNDDAGNGSGGHDVLSQESKRQQEQVNSQGLDTINSELNSSPVSQPQSHSQHKNVQREKQEHQTQGASPDQDPVTSTWLTMRNTLSEIDLAASSGATVFSAAHASALEDLRKAQIALAQAWGRSEAEDEAQLEGSEAEAENRAKGVDGLPGEGGVLGGRDTGVLDRDGSSTANATANNKGRGTNLAAEERSTKSQLEEETENDIRLARKRRMANDRYFERVNKGVVDVVAKLEDVATKMKSVEMESQEIWGDDNSLDSG